MSRGNHRSYLSARTKPAEPARVACNAICEMSAKETRGLGAARADDGPWGHAANGSNAAGRF